METLKAMLASVSYIQIIIAVLCFLCILYFCQSNGLPCNWPLIGMFHTYFPLTLHFCDHISKLIELSCGTFEIKGLWLANRDMIVTADPRNVQHVLSTNFSTYPKGPDSRKMFEAYGEILFSSDHDVWRRERKFVHAFLHNPWFQHFTVKINREILENGLIPVLDHACEHGLVLDLQEVLQRYMLDATCMMITGHNQGFLRVGLPEVAVLNALHDVGEAILWRHILPESFWKFQSWLGIGKEKKLSKASKIIDDAVIEYLNTWKEQVIISKESQENFDAINFYFNEKELLESIGDHENVMKGTVKGLIFGGADTTSPILPWFFWLLSQNPIVECKIRKELAENFPGTKSDSNNRRLIFEPEELNKLVYLHGALCETLRLYPSVPFQPRTCINADILPSGHHVKPNVRIILCTHAMGRMKSIWGQDCLEFKPERWISERGGIKAMVSSKFLAFSAGPRICMGKEMAFTRLKAVASTILYNYQIQIIKDQPAATPTNSIFLHVKHGLLVKVTRSKD